MSGTRSNIGLDTGTTLILMSDATVDNYYGAVSGASFDDSQGGYTFPCSADLPTLSFIIGSNYATIPSSLMNFAPTDPSGMISRPI
jgi:Eukaryotic aspartyl protease